MKTSKEIVEDMQAELNSFLNEANNSIESVDRPLIPTGIDVFDLLSGGGIGQGIFVHLVGYTGSFKSTLAVQIGKAFKTYNPNALIMYIDTEYIMTETRLKSLGLTNVKPRTGYTLESIFKDIETFVNFKESKNLTDIPSLVIWDSIANTPTDSETKTMNINETLGLKARILSGKLPILLNKINKANITILAINQLRDDISMGMFSSNTPDLKHLDRDKKVPGGHALIFNSSQMFQNSVKTSYDDEKNESPYGFRSSIIKVKSVKNKFFPDNYTVELVVDVANGIDNLYSNFELLKKYKKINVSSWNYLTRFPEVKFRLKELRTIYNNNPDFRTNFDNEVKDTIQELKNKMNSLNSINEIGLDDDLDSTETNNNSIDEVFKDE
jgi:RecA/RadA recombinase